MTEELDNLATIVDMWRRELAEDEGEWVPLAEAERLAGVSRSSLRAWYRAGMPSRLEPGPNGPQRLVRLEDALARARNIPARRSKAPKEKETDVSDANPTSAAALLKLVETVCAQAETRAEKAEAAWREAVERAAAAEAELRLLRERLAE